MFRIYTVVPIGGALTEQIILNKRIRLHVSGGVRLGVR